MRHLQPQSLDPDPHSRAIESLAAELRLPRGKVELAYGIVLKRLEEEAAVSEFLTVFARRGARQCLLCVERRAQCATRTDCILAIDDASAEECADPFGGAAGSRTKP